MAEIDGHNQELQARLEEAQHKNEKDSQGHKAELVEYKRKSESRTSELQKQLEEAKQSAEELKEKARAVSLTECFFAYDSILTPLGRDCAVSLRQSQRGCTIGTRGSTNGIW